MKTSAYRKKYKKNQISKEEFKKAKKKNRTAKIKKV